MKNTGKQRNREHVSPEEVQKLLAGSRQEGLLRNPEREKVTNGGVFANTPRQRIYNLFAVLG